MKEMKLNPSRFCVLLGACLLMIAAVVLSAWQWGMHDAQQKASAYVHTIGAQIPGSQSAALEERRDNAMAVLSVDGTDFVGILELPRCGSSLPVCADWGNITQYPCRFSGSIYDRTMRIGGTSQKGQYDFYREISVGDSAFFTDMEGNRFSYEVTDIHYEKHVDQAALQQEDAALILFIKNVYSLEYIIIFCNSVG